MLLGGRYELLEPIGRGGMATVYQGLNLGNGRIIAVKVMREAYSMKPEFEAFFHQEMKVKSVLHHPNIVQIYDYGESRGMYYIVMELIEGTDLRRYLRFRGILSANQAAIIAHDIALGLGAAHRSDIVSCNVIPQNILIGHDDLIRSTDMDGVITYGNIKVKLLMTTIAGITPWTVGCYAPEQGQGENITPAADIYALGILMYEMLTRRIPFDGDTPVAVALQHVHEVPTPPSQYNPNIPPALEAIVLRCLEKVPELRYRNGTMLAQALEAFMKEAF